MAVEGSATTNIDFLAEGGALGAMMRGRDWSTSPLGAPQTWPQSLRSVVGLLLSSKFPMFVAWGDELGFLYNDAYAELLGAKHPGALGARFQNIWTEIWPDISPLIDAAMAGEATYREDLPLVMNRKGFDERTWFTFSYSPVRDETGAVAGMFCACTETTGKVLLERRQAFRLSLEERLRGAADPRQIMNAAVEALGLHLGAARVGYSEVRPDGETIDCRSCYADGVDPVFGTFKLADFGIESIERQRRGETEVTADIQADPAQKQDTWAALETRAFVSVPLVRDGAIRASLYVNRREPHAWSAEEVALIQEVAARTWSAVERAVAEAGEREKAARLTLALEAGRLAEVTFDLAGGVSHSAAYAELFGHPPDKTLQLSEIRAQYHPDDHDRVVAERRRILDSGQGFYQVEKRIVRPDGEVRWVYGRGEVERDAEGRPLTVTAVYIDDTERKRAEMALRASEARQTFLLALGDRLRGLSDAEEVKAAAAEMLGRRFGVARAGYGEVDEAGEVIRVERDWSDGMSSLAGEARLLGGFGRSIATELRAGRTLRVDDCALDPRVQGEGVAEVWASIDLRAVIAVPLVKEGRFDAFLYLHEPKPRAWTDDEEALAREVAERTWDAVERARSEAALRESEARLAAVIESLPVGVGVVDLKGCIVLSNSEMRRFLPTGRIPSRDEERLPRWRAWHLDGRPIDPSDFPGARATRGERVVPGLEMLYTDDGGQEVWTRVATVPIEDGEGRLVGHTAAVSDIDALKRIAEALRESEERLRELNATLEERVAERTAELRLHRDINEANASPICAFDTAYRLIAFNQAHSDEFFRIFGHRVQLGEVFPNLFPPDQAPTIRSFMARALAGERYTVVEEFGDPDLVKPYWEVSYTPLRDDAGRVVGAFHFANDITARLRAEAELKTAQEALRQSQKMEAVGQLTGGLAHDFNNILAGISGSLDLMGTRIAQGRIAEVERYMIAAQGAAKRAAALTHRLLAFSRRQTLEPRPTDVNRLVAEMEELIRRTMGPAIEVETVAAAGLWPTLVDPHQLENALLNLCINARDAMPEGGKLTIETANRWLDERAARTRDLHPGPYVSLCASDNGAGMPPEVVERAFDPFFTTKPIGQGTGLGLSMIYGFARQSGGQARIYSEVGKGTTVCLHLPRHHAQEEADALEPVAETGRAETGETVLVIDDEPLVRMVVVEVLEELGYVAIEADDGPEGLKVIRSDVRLDLLITDVGLPNGMNGRQVADAAREVRPDLKVLFVTGYAENAVLSHGHLEPGMQVVTKPFDMARLTSRIQEMVSGG